MLEFFFKKLRILFKWTKFKTNKTNFKNVLKNWILEKAKNKFYFRKNLNFF